MPRIEEVVNDIARAVHHRIALQNENNERDLNVKIPLTRLRRIMKLEVDSSTLNITKDALVDLAQAIRAFIRILSSLAWNLSVAADNRTMFQPRDLQVAVNASKRFDFLVDILDVLKQNTRTPIYTLRLPHPYPHLIPNMQHPTAPSLTAPPGHAGAAPMEPPPLVNNEQYMRQQGLLAQQQQLLALQRLQHGLDANCSMTSGGGPPGGGGGAQPRLDPRLSYADHSREGRPSSSQQGPHIRQSGYRPGRPSDLAGGRQGR